MVNVFLTLQLNYFSKDNSSEFSINPISVNFL